MPKQAAKSKALQVAKAPVKLNPIAAEAARLRKAVGDNTFPVLADKMLAGIKQRRASAQAEKAAGY